MTGIMMATFMGGAPVVQILARSPYDISYSGYAYTDSTFNSTGTWTSTANSGGTTTFNWLLSGAASDYELSFSTVSGSPLGLTAGTWYGMGTTRTIYIEASGLAYVTATISLSIRKASGGAVLVSGVQHSFIAESKP